jgi:putative transposase
MAYPEKLRQAALNYLDKGHSYVQTAATFGIGTTTLWKWIKKLRGEGTLKDATPQRPWKKIDPVALEAYVKDNPDKMIKEYAQHFAVATSTMHNALKKLGFTRKKKLNTTKSGKKLYVWCSKKK